ncbi:MAG TPA: pyridoxamine 5'-phosphate oxidase family protein [Patescibacteria group bacterium]|nr:pyridoxamine 5'-phosphate oxidase family protein [Patescibacteria group bacterium]
MEPDLAKRVASVKTLLAEIHHAAIATVNEDGSPHNNPVFMAFDHQLNGYWGSHPESVHSKNIAHTGQVYIVLFDSRAGHVGLYIEAQAEMLTNQADIDEAWEVTNRAKTSFGVPMSLPEQYVGDAPQRFYRARPLKLWVNKSERDESGAIIRDHRIEITLEDLANA